LIFDSRLKAKYKNLAFFIFEWWLFMQTDILRNFTGSYIGNGLNHENQKFNGAFSLNYSAELKAFKIVFKASGLQGEIFHYEEPTIAPSLMQKWTLWNLNSNTPGLLAHELTDSKQTDRAHVLTFTFGDISQTNSFRESITLQLNDDQSLEYTYAWGMPGGEFKQRSSVRMSKN
jgi:hypothetical protein